MTEKINWTQELKDTLTALWGEGHSTAEIGRRMCISKNAVVGKAKRMRLPARPSPIIRGRPKPAVSVGRNPTLPKLSVAAPTKQVVAQSSALIAGSPVDDGEEPALPERTERHRVRPAPSGTCCWPMGEPGTKAFHFCSSLRPDADRRKLYCAEHRALAFVRVRDRREDAA